MTPTRSLARPMLASMFILGGVDALRHPETKVAKAQTVAPRLARILGLPEDTETVVRLNGAAQLLGGSFLAAGKVPRLASTVLAASLVPTTVAGHRFWEEEDRVRRRQQQVQFLKNTAMLGGLILAAVDTEGRPSIAWRLRRSITRTRRAGRRTPVSALGHDISRAGDGAMHRSVDAGRLVASRIASASESASDALRTAAGTDLAKSAVSAERKAAEALVSFAGRADHLAARTAAAGRR